jgi:hypothetical protein
MDRLDYVSMMSQEIAFSSLVEKVLNNPIAENNIQIRVLVNEITRILNHILSITTHILDVGALTPFLWLFEERKILLEFYEKFSGARMHAAYVLPCMRRHDMNKTLVEDFYHFCTKFGSRTQELELLLQQNSVLRDRLVNIGNISFNASCIWNLTGPLVRGVGLPRDLRTTIPWDRYQNWSLPIPTSKISDCITRIRMHVDELIQALAIMRRSTFFNIETSVTKKESSKTRIFENVNEEIFNPVYRSSVNHSTTSYKEKSSEDTKSTESEKKPVEEQKNNSVFEPQFAVLKTCLKIITPFIIFLLIGELPENADCGDHPKGIVFKGQNRVGLKSFRKGGLKKWPTDSEWERDDRVQTYESIRSYLTCSWAGAREFREIYLAARFGDLGKKITEPSDKPEISAELGRWVSYFQAFGACLVLDKALDERNLSTKSSDLKNVHMHVGVSLDDARGPALNFGFSIGDAPGGTTSPEDFSSVTFDSNIIEYCKKYNEEKEAARAAEEVARLAAEQEALFWDILSHYGWTFWVCTTLIIGIFIVRFLKKESSTFTDWDETI